jgi:Zn-dependent peptidase ImmA (M78 family)
MRGKNFAAKRARRLLSQCNLSPRDIEYSNTEDLSTDLKKVAKKLGIKIIQHAFSENISGVFFRKDNKLFLGVNSDHHEHRRRFTIAHEIGHYILHSDEMLHYDKDELENIYLRSDDISSPEEIEANHFAAELLMPEELILKCIENDEQSIKVLAERFNVSEHAMRYRLTNLGFL